MGGAYLPVSTHHMAVDERDCHALLESDAPLEDVLTFMRDGGASRIESMRLLIDLKGLSLADAKTTVHSSQTWSDLRASAEEFHEALERVLREEHR